jgi:PAS domain S-box-containing protein
VQRQLALVVCLFVAIVGCLLFLVDAQLEIMSGVRAYVGGEGLSSKGQKDAAYHLLRYAASHDPREYVRYRAAVAVPLGDRRARRQLERAASAADGFAASGFVEGRNHPDDVPIMMQLFRRFRHVSFMATAVDVWRQADRDVARLVAVGDALHAAIAGEHASPEETARLLRKIDVLNDRLTPLGEAFSATLGAGARWLRVVLMRIMVVAATVLLGVGVLLSWMLLRQTRIADAALRASEERYRDLFDNANDLVYMHDLQGNLRSANNATARVTGYTREEALRMNIAQIVAPECLALAREMTARKVAGGAPSLYELEVVAKDGHRVQLEVSTRIVLDHGRPVGVHGIARDVSERKRTEAALEREGRISAALARAGGELISALETPVLFERLCQLATELLGCTAGRTLLWDAGADVFAPVAAVGEIAGGALLASSPSRGALALLFAGSGDVAEPEPGLLAMALRHGRDLVGVQIVSGERGYAFTPEQRRIAEGVAQVASLALANSRLIAELARASRLKSEFVSTMSHELRTPLNVILGYAEMAREPSLDEAERADNLRRIEQAARDLLDLIESTLEVGRIDAGRDVVRLEAIRLRDFLADLGEACRRLPRRSAVRFSWPDDVADCVVTTDPRKLIVVVRNLVGNALKFTEHGEVRVAVDVSDEAVVLAVSDTGIGIRREDQASIFEMFRQADGSDTRRFGGTGLGLYIVRRFVDQLNGRIALESAPGCGATFTITLPRRMPPAAVSRAA